MKWSVVVLVMLFASCSQKEPSSSTSPTNDEEVIKQRVTAYHAALAKYLGGAPMDVDSLVNEYFDPNVYYVTYWGMAEPIDTTKKRFKAAVANLKNYESSLENLKVKSFGTGAYAFFTQRQYYTLSGELMDEYLPTTWVLEKKNGKWMVIHSQRGADLQTVQGLMEVARHREAKETAKK